MAEEQLVLFSIGDGTYAMPITQVKEIIGYTGATRLPDSPEYIQGVISLRGGIILLIDLALRLSQASSKTADRRALIVETAGREVGLVVDDVMEVIRLADSAIEPAPAGIGNGYIRGIGKDRGRLLILLDIDKLFAGTDLQEPEMVG